MSEQHQVYLGVPGPTICWSTVIAILRSTQKHVAQPKNLGVGFDGTEDFNMVWNDAQNAFRRGEITHFAMLHGDIQTDPEQYWLDILLEEMDARGASLVSAASPIKDNRGLTSSGIADLADPWMPYRRFTVRELHELLPETFDNAAAGYPDRPLLHNTGLWVCDLRRPEFRAIGDDGTLALRFAFPTRSILKEDGELHHQRESEDWYFSRELWARGVRDTFITRRVRITHFGKAAWTNHSPWGTFLDGDENTAHKWRGEVEGKPLAPLQLLNFELSGQCNLSALHGRCPCGHPERFADPDDDRALDDDTIVRSATVAYRDLGFTGLVGFAYYNEPLLEADRMFAIMARIKAAAPAARFILWTNGTFIPEECEAYRQFSQICVSLYGDASRRGRDHLAAKQIPFTPFETPALDNRMDRLPASEPSAPCLRPFVEIAFDYRGHAHLCCYDWRGEASPGNVIDEPIETIARRWRDGLPAIAGPTMTDDAPAACRACGHRWTKYQQHDARIVARARRLRDSYAAQPAEATEPAEAAQPEEVAT